MKFNRRQLFKTVTAGAVGTVVAKAAFPSGLQPLPKKDTPRTFDYPLGGVITAKDGYVVGSHSCSLPIPVGLLEYLGKSKQAVFKGLQEHKN